MNAAEAGHGGQVVLPNSRRGNGGSGVGGDGGVRPSSPEYCLPVYCDSSTTAGSAGDMAVVGSGRNQLRARGREGGRGRRGGGEEGIRYGGGGEVRIGGGRQSRGETRRGMGH